LGQKFVFRSDAASQMIIVQPLNISNSACLPLAPNARDADD
jgi:hypothetical protein